MFLEIPYKTDTPAVHSRWTVDVSVLGSMLGDNGTAEYLL
ncbi:hypothetical protein HMPREF0663_10159 [Hoylesella oralis ATCC 33269]|uniref:Uncharacterized protein n=1 Tax=Hoylesella oralis ATCC 33269 TaxID=873533 RepID=E7RM09_9BACT|nr:hypothetical protein HMPREF0663_10159 [Hoylesella oralis ATCC 33269]